MADAQHPLQTRPGGFLGQHRVKLDAKNRVVMPAVLRRLLPAGDGALFVLRQGRSEGYLRLQPHGDWVAEAESFEVLAAELRADLERAYEADELDDPTFDRELAEIDDQRRKLMAESRPVELDPKGRFAVDAELLKMNSIREELMVLGVGRFIELVSPKKYFADRDAVPTGESLVRRRLRARLR